MSKRNKNIEGLVEAALVPKDEQPYEIPSNWVWVSLKDVCHINMGQSPKGEYTTENSSFTPLIGGPADMGDKYPRVSRYTTKPTKLTVEGELILSIRATLGKTNIADGEYCLGRGVAGLKSEIIDISLLRNYFNIIKSHLYTVSTGTTFPQISRKDIESILFPLPPLNEQKRIVEKVESLLSKIKEAKQLIEEAKETFELRRAAILDMAFRGVLTQKWRKQNLSHKFVHEVSNVGPYEIPKEWKWTTIGDITSFVGSGSTPKGGSKIYQSHGVPFVRSQNVLKNRMITDDIVYISKEVHATMKRTHMLGTETLLNITGASIGRAAKLRRELVPCNINQHVCALRFIDDINEEFPQYWLNSPYIQKVINEMQIGVTRQALNFPQVKSLPIPLIPRDEQDEIVKIITTLLNKEDECLKLVKMENDVEKLKQSILSKVFRGELGTNDPNDENAVELIKKMLQ